MKDVAIAAVALVLGIVILGGTCAAIDNDINQTAAEPHNGMVWRS